MRDELENRRSKESSGDGAKRWPERFEECD
jgi:hypothetical protein